MAKERRSLFSRLFGSDESTVAPKTATKFEVLNGYKPVFTKYDGKYYDDGDVRSCVDAIARNGAKLEPKHIRLNDKGYENVNDQLQRLLSKQPNELQNAYKFRYQIISELEMHNNAIVYIMKDEKMKIVGLYPLAYQSVEFFEYKNEIWIQFYFSNGKKRFVPLKDCIHLTRFVSENGIMGGNDKPIIKVLSIKHVLDEGIVNAIKTTQSIKGVIRSTQAMLKPEDVKKMRDQFVKDFIDNGDQSGIGGLDASTEFTPVKIEPTTASDGQIKSIDDKILNYFGISKEIVQSNYSEDQWNAFYESILEPIGIQMGLEFSNKLFSATEVYHGNEIIFTSNRLQYASNNTKINLMQHGNNILMVDEMREVLNLEPLPNGMGQKVMQDLNHIDSTIANDYQSGGTKKEEENDKDEKGN